MWDRSVARLSTAAYARSTSDTDHESDEVTKNAEQPVRQRDKVRRWRLVLTYVRSFAPLCHCWSHDEADGSLFVTAGCSEQSCQRAHHTQTCRAVVSSDSYTSGVVGCLKAREAVYTSARWFFVFPAPGCCSVVQRLLCDYAKRHQVLQMVIMAGGDL